MASSRKRSRVTTGPSHSVGAYPSSPENLLKLSQPHIDSFDYFLKTSIHDAVADIPAQEMKVGASDATLRWWVDSIWIGKPTKNEAGCASHNLTPRECRERGVLHCHHSNITGDLCVCRTGVWCPNESHDLV